ncbi:methanogen output domain 1-containing protein [Pseudoblastomonas halimionae]|uniref:Transcriptional regulator n=1 Tax=Alteriqipengyuania halimionae TaxID=1926630 RepID=A0A6I4U0B6_9SPHN|nr:methanogen output domain 1-containing protein [Alteriqipengyuania halimionae]MXP09318.1 transcriptional regulator [Alteriqipengyuania halimionae]
MQELDLPLDRDLFFRKMISSFAKSLEETVGLDEAAGYVALVGSEIGTWIEDQYKESSGKERFEPEELAELLVDLKGRIGGKFHVISVDDDQIVLGNDACPFAELAEGRPALCRMTSNVFGRITANQLGYARVDLQETIAKGDGRCRVVINLKPTDTAGDEDHEFFRVDDDLI